MSIKHANRYYLWFTILGGIFTIIGPFILELFTDFKDAPTLLNYLFWFVIGCILLKKDNAPFFETLPYNRGLSFKTVLLLILLTFLCQPMTTLLSWLGATVFGNFLKDVNLESQIGDNILMNVFSIAVIPAVFEEMYFRGFFYSPYRKAAGARTAILLSAFMFGIFHMNFQQAIYACFFGIVMATVRELTGSMWAGMLIHFVNNGESALLMSIYKLYNEPAWLKYLPSYHLGFDDAWHTVYTLIMLLVCSLLAYFVVKKIAKEYGKEEDFKNFFAGDHGAQEKIVTPALVIGILFCFLAMIAVAVFMPALVPYISEAAGVQ